MMLKESAVLGDAREQVVREELQVLLESAAFRNSKRCREFLGYIVEHTLSGPRGALRERAIGVELFELPEDFDTGQHTIVRVTANEVRKKLALHYQSEHGRSHPVRIDLPRGSYTADFCWEEPAQPQSIDVVAAPQAVPVVAPAAPARRLDWRWLVGAGAVLLVAGSAFFIWRRSVSSANDEFGSYVPSIPAAAMAGNDVRIIAGASTGYVDHSGRLWSADRYFTGGSASLAQASERIMRTLDADIYRHLRTGDFRYDIPLEPGLYELRLHFSETGFTDSISAESSGEGQRLFRIKANGRQLLDNFDVVADAAGTNISDERVFRNIAPASDGVLHLSFESLKTGAMLSAIEVLPMVNGKTRAIRIRAGRTGPWQDSTGQQWLADSYFMGGNAMAWNTNPARGNQPADPAVGIYDTERWGHFTYSLPAAEGRYRLSLRFCPGGGRRSGEAGGPGSRVFDVYCNGVTLLKNFDIFREAGGDGRPVERSFSNLHPNAQGKIVLHFVPVVGMACVNGIELTEESK